MSEPYDLEYRPDFYTNPALSADLLEAVSEGVDLEAEAFRHDPNIILPIGRLLSNQVVRFVAELLRTEDEIIEAGQVGTVAPISGARITTTIARQNTSTTLTVGAGQTLGTPPQPGDLVTDLDLENIFGNIRLREDEIATLRTEHLKGQEQERHITLNRPHTTETIANGMLLVLRDGIAL